MDCDLPERIRADGDLEAHEVAIQEPPHGFTAADAFERISGSDRYHLIRIKGYEAKVQSVMVVRNTA
jgi:hypothetical protein